MHGDADTTVPMIEGETMHAALTKAGVAVSFIRIEGAGHGFEGANLERASAAMVQWFERHLGSAAKWNPAETALRSLLRPQCPDHIHP